MTVSVLYVDDETPHLMLAEEYLGQSGRLTLTCVSSGREAIEALSHGSFEVIVSDYQMQDMDGVSLLKYVRKNFGIIPFLLFTGKGKEEVVIEALNNGADYYIRKGSDPVEQFSILEQRILQVANRQSAREELAAREQLYHSVITVQTEMLADFLPDLTVIRSNDAYAGLHGGGPTDMIGKKFLADISGGDLDNIRNVVHTLSIENPASDLHLVATTHDGRSTPLAWHIEGVFSSDGSLVSCKATGRDMSPEQEAREEIRSFEEKYLETATDIPRHMGDFDENVPLNFIIENTRPAGSWLLPEMVKKIKADKMSGISAATGSDGHRAFLIFVNGEPEGSIYIDRSGVLYGDKSVLFLKDSQHFTFYPTESETALRFVTGCRIYDKSHIRAPSSYDIPEIVSVKKGVGNITLELIRKGQPVVGLRITIKSGGKIVGNDISSPLGQITFQLLYGTYTGVILTEKGNLHSFNFTVEKPDSSHIVDLA
ncbi:MAG TPA: response regulator [Methanospirillum sp.]|nr:response regulator [Methanospirillum sp.]